MDAREDNLSTFAMDVDTASYTKLRDYLRNGQMPPADLIRVEECVNYFKQEYPDPSEGAFSINLEAARSPFSPEGTYLLKVGLQGKHMADWQRKDASLTFVMDVSGSMQEDNKIEHGEVRPDQAGRSAGSQRSGGHCGLQQRCLGRARTDLGRESLSHHRRHQQPVSDEFHQHRSRACAWATTWRTATIGMASSTA